jgi:hypothetical protein
LFEPVCEPLLNAFAPSTRTRFASTIVPAVSLPMGDPVKVR